MAKFKPYVAEQLMLFPNSIRDYVPQEHLARVVDTVVEKLDTSSIEEQYSDLGQNTYHPKILIKMLFYGYAIGERSGRVIAKKTQTDTAYIYLSQMYKPDFRTINDFRKTHIQELSQYFVDIVRLCKDLGLLKIGKINIDGTKIKANASNKLTKTEEEYNKWLNKTRQKIDDIMKEAQATDEEEDNLYGDKSGDELPEDINTDKKLKDKLEKVMKRFKETKESNEKINLTDSDAKFMKGGDGKINTSYNCQAAAVKNQLIVASEVTNKANDRGELETMIEAAEETLEEEVSEIAADAGYSSYDNYEYLAKKKKTGYIPDQGMTKAQRQEYGPFHEENFRYNKKTDSYTCPEGQTLRRYKIRRQENSYRSWQQVIYKASECRRCINKPQCTRQSYRTLARDDRRGLLEEMRKRLLSKLGKKKYKQRLSIEPIFGHIKHNLKYRYFLLRTLNKVKGEFRLMCIGHNLKKMHLMGAFST